MAEGPPLDKTPELALKLVGGPRDGEIWPFGHWPRPKLLVAHIERPEPLAGPLAAPLAEPSIQAVEHSYYLQQVKHPLPDGYRIEFYYLHESLFNGKEEKQREQGPVHEPGRRAGEPGD